MTPPQQLVTFRCPECKRTTLQRAAATVGHWCGTPNRWHAMKPDDDEETNGL